MLLQLRYGWEISRIGLPHTGTTELGSHTISRVKLMNDTNELTRDFRERELRPKLQKLIEEGFIEDESDVMVDFFEKILRHTKSQLSQS